MTLLLLQRYWRILLAGAVAALLVWIWIYALHKAESKGYQRAQAEMAARVAQANAATAALEQRQREQSQQAAQVWEKQRNELESQVARVLASPLSRPVVRLCKPSSSGELPSASPATTGLDGATQQRVDALQMGPDIGGAATVLAGECESNRLKLIAVQSWVQQVSASSTPR